MKRKFSLKTGRIAAACYAAALAVWLALALAAWMGDAAAAAAGRMVRQTLAAGDFTLVNLEQAGSVLSCTTPDPQLHWEVPAGQRVRSAVLRARYDLMPQEISLYYRTAGQTDFSAAQRVYAQKQADGSYLFRLPRTDVTALRLDPCSTVCVISDFSLTVNAPLAPWRYFLPSWWQLLEGLLYPGLAASAAGLVHGAAALRGERARRFAAEDKNGSKDPSGGK